MVPFAGAEPTARFLVQCTAMAFVLSEITIRLRSAAHRDHARADRGSIVAVVGAIAAGVLVAAWCASTHTGDVRSAGAVMLGVGIALMWIGIAVRQWAVWVLGPFFTVVVRVSKQQSVIDRGPYRWVRHPSYSGLLLTMIGLGMAFENWLSLLALATLPLLGLMIRIRVEERALVATLGEPYRAYAADRRRLVPGLW
jgi:protein-S-isoprenylcysteine O-methyltransferase Ste14